MSYIEHIKSKVRYNHPLGVLFDALAKIGIKIVPYYLLLEKLPEDGLQHLESGFEDYSVTLLGPEDMKVIARIPERNVSEEELLQRLQRGMICLGVKQEEQLVAFTWADLHECHYQGYRFPLEEDEGYLFDAHTLMAFRGKRIAPYMRYKLYKEQASSGRTRLYSISNRLHRSSVKFKMRLNAEIIDRGIHIELFGKWNFITKAEHYRD